MCTHIHVLRMTQNSIKKKIFDKQKNNKILMRKSCLVHELKFFGGVFVLSIGVLNFLLVKGFLS